MADDNQHPPLPIAVELAPRLLARAESTEGLLDEVRRSIATGVGDLMARLGVPGEPAVALSALAEGSSQSQFLRLSVGGAPCRYPDRLLARVYSFLTATPLQPPNLERIAGWLEGPAEAGEPSRLARFLETACPAILALDPACLLAREQLDAYLAALPDGSPSSALPPETLLEILRELLHLRLSLRDRLALSSTVRVAGSRRTRSPRRSLCAAPEIVITLPGILQQLRAAKALHPDARLFYELACATRTSASFPTRSAVTLAVQTRYRSALGRPEGWRAAGRELDGLPAGD